MNRRSLILVSGLIAAILIGGWILIKPAQSPNEALTVVSFGGAYQEAQRVAYMLPFAEVVDIDIVEGEYNGDYGVIRERATSANGAWDVISVESAPALRGQIEDLFLPIPESTYSGIRIADGAVRERAAGHLIFSTILAFRSDSDSATPSTWEDFWNTEAFPGKRGLRNNPRGTLEIALLADGVPAADLYPLDIERAFRKLDDIREHLIFWDSGAQPIQLLANNTVTMTSIYNGRAWAARNDENLPISWSLKNGLLEVEFWAVPKNAPNPEKAFEFIRFSLETNQQAKFANQIAYVPTNLDATELIEASVKSGVPDLSKDEQINVDAVWWSENEAVVLSRWQEWISSE